MAMRAGPARNAPQSSVVRRPRASHHPIADAAASPTSAERESVLVNARVMITTASNSGAPSERVTPAAISRYVRASAKWMRTCAIRYPAVNGIANTSQPAK